MQLRLIDNGRMDDGAKVPGQDALLKPEANIASGNGTSRSHNPRRRKLIRLALALLVAGIAVTAWLVWDSTPPGPPHILTMPSGAKFQFVGATYGTRNVPPSLEAKVFSALPRPLQNWAWKYVGPQISQDNRGEKFETPRLFIWFKRLGTNVPPRNPLQLLTARLADQEGIEAGVEDYQYFEKNFTWHYASFSVIPRRSRVLQLSLYPFGVGGVGAVSIPNPLYGHFPQWKPEPVPAVKMAGDVQVRLDDFAAGMSYGINERQIYSGAFWKGDTATSFGISLLSPRGTNEVWSLHSAELSDATGNFLRSISRNQFLEDHILQRPSFRGYIPATLWPDESAWRLKLELKRASNFAPEEIVTFKNVPVPAVGTTNLLNLTKTAGGIRIVLTKFVRQPNIFWPSNQSVRWASQITVELLGKPAGVALDFVNMTTDAGTPQRYDSGMPDFPYVVYVNSIPTSAKTMDLTWVVQKTRTVEFLVQPPKAK